MDKDGRNISIYLKEREIQAADKYAKQLNISRSKLFGLMIRKALNKTKKLSSS